MNPSLKFVCVYIRLIQIHTHTHKMKQCRIQNKKKVEITQVSIMIVKSSSHILKNELFCLVNVDFVAIKSIFLMNPIYQQNMPKYKFPKL